MRIPIIPKTKTEFLIWLYSIAIVFFTICALVIVGKFILWPPCTQLPNINTCAIEPWSAAGVIVAILGVAATVLAILGAVAVAGWWGYLENRVNDQVNVKVGDVDKRVTDQVNMLYSEQEKKMNTQVDALLAETRKNAGFIFEHFVSEPEFLHLQNFTNLRDFLVSSSSPVDPFQAELRHLESVGFIARVPGYGFRALREAFQQKPEVNVKDYFYIADAGKAYLEIRTKL